MPDTLTYAVEAAVGAACLLAAAGVWRRPGLRLVSIVLAIAGLAALIHAVASLV